MVIINGKVYNSTNVTIINGQVVNDENDGNAKQIEETKVIKGNVKNLAIVSGSVDVSFLPAETEDITVQLIGSCSRISTVPTLAIKESEKETSITVDMPKKAFNCFIGRISLYVMLPKKVYNSITIIGQSSDVSFTKLVECHSLNISTISGDIEVYTKCKHLDMSTTSGDIDVDLQAEENASIKIRSVSGDIELNLNDVSSLSLYPTTISGDIINRFRTADKGCSAVAYIATTSGDIKIH